VHRQAGTRWLPGPQTRRESIDVPTSERARVWAKERVTGLWTALTTPFDADGRIIEADLRRNVCTCLELELDGIGWGLLGEPWSLTRGQRRHGLEIVIDEVGGRLPVYGYATEHSLPEAVLLAQHAAAAGADLVMVNPPFEYAQSADTVRRYVGHVAEKADIGVILYNSPHSGFRMTPELIADLVADNASICALKDGYGDLALTAETIRAVGDEIQVSHAFEERWLQAFTELGSPVLLGSSSLYLLQVPGRTPVRRYTDLMVAGDVEGARAASAELAGLRTAWRSIYQALFTQNRHPYAAVKLWQDLIGMKGGHPGIGCAPLSPAERQAVAHAVRLAGLVESGS
jgi:4-hydroxy-tetrahydrodipicolinate synthase